MRRAGRWLRGITLAVAVAVALGFVGRLLFPLPELETRSVSAAVPASEATALGAAIVSGANANPGRSGVMPLQRGPEAFAARMDLTRAAEASIDAQYYMWRHDSTGLALMSELAAAANRGVRVRLLLDDVGTYGLDAEIAALDALPNAEVRLFNPFTLRYPRWPVYLWDFARMNRRMHNKAFIVDGAVAVLGGRNVGDSYFSSAAEGHYSDFDVIAAGPAAAEAAAVFDAYWASGSAYPAALLVPPTSAPIAAAEAPALGTESFFEAAEKATLAADIAAGSAPFEWVRATVLADDPAKGLGDPGEDGLLIGQLATMAGEPERRIDLISAYFVPGRRGTEVIAGLAARGVQTRVLTNSLEATDVFPVHAGYAAYRDALLDAGVELYEMKSSPVPLEEPDRFGILASATSSLHAKVFTIDGTRAFVGSFNFDPRSFFLNCEMGILVESTALAAQLEQVFSERVRLNAYRVLRTAGGGTEWVETLPDGGEVRYTAEPRTNWAERAAVHFLSWLPITWMF